MQFSIFFSDKIKTRPKIKQVSSLRRRVIFVEMDVKDFYVPLMLYRASSVIVFSVVTQ